MLTGIEVISFREICTSGTSFALLKWCMLFLASLHMVQTAFVSSARLECSGRLIGYIKGVKPFV